ncbi:MAG: acyl-CoA dehydrogenase family protein [Chloroflexi bacterium]|nr:acyl-CoA dehydrogenase family protein [Chloroflexota bacterium]MCI0576047.1 acyl-CoA dehydrogenase family protein [Chloroflexota bacterium]MCI0647835.1 acyl-CoA dehydrogenase family protein [Chloroflexota bacterium]MCI0727086.1 acyl-CoA dehydrogenase family protein [Chloroflexota bacterium]
MINFELPERITNELQMARMVAEQVLRPHSRYYDEHEHERPWEYINMMWPVLRDQQRKQLERSANGQETRREGPGIATVRLVMLVEMFSWGDAGQYLSTPTPALGGAAIEAVGTPEQKERFLRKFTEGDPKWGAMAMTEPGAGSDTSAIRTTAVLDQETNEWVLNGEKIFCTNGALALEESNGLVVVWATVNPGAGRAGMKPFVVEAGTPGVSIAKKENKLGIRASDTAAIVFRDARIPYDNILGSAEVQRTDDGTTKGFQGAMRTFDATRPVVAASAMGIARAALEYTRDRLAEEGVVLDYTRPRHALTAVERDLLEMEAQYKAAWLLTLRAASMMDHGRANRLEASMCKARAGEAVTWITQKAVELLGPLGYSQELLVEKWMRDAKINDIYEGTKQINLLIVARSILGYSRRELK